MLQRIHNNFNVQCDICGEDETFYTDDFYQALDEIKDNGWWPTNVSGQWEHHCYNCQRRNDNGRKS